MVPNRLIAWRILPDQLVEHAGTVHFERTRGGTRIHVDMRFSPPAGAIGNTIAQIFGFDPKSLMDDDLIRLKGLLEQGRTRAHGQQVSLDEVAATPQQR